MKSLRTIYYAIWAKSIDDVTHGGIRDEGSWQEILIPLFTLGILLNVVSLILVTIFVIGLLGHSTQLNAGLQFVTKGSMRFLLLAVVTPASLLCVYWSVLRRRRYDKIVRVYRDLCQIKYPMHWYIGASFIVDVALIIIILMIR